MRPDLSSLVQIGIPVLMAAMAWGAASARLDIQDRDLASLQRALELERAERLAYQAQQVQARMAWLLQRGSRRLDPDISRAAGGAPGDGSP